MSKNYFQILKRSILFFIREERKTEETKILMAKLLINSNNTKEKIDTLEEVEFKVFSEWGDDGIIQYLINKLPIKNKTFIEFGVQDYKEANTRFLLVNNNWSGLVIDGGSDNIKSIKEDYVSWKYDLEVLHSFVTAENINDLIKNAGIEGDIGILHIDIDGNDYWIWKSIEAVSADIVIMEYNSAFGIEKAITVPYKSDFVRTKQHYSNVYFGCSLLALCDLAETKGYTFIGCNSSGNNAYFVKNEVLSQVSCVHRKQPNEGYVECKFKQGRNKKGELIHVKDVELIKNIHGLPVFNTRTNQIEYL